MAFRDTNLSTGSAQCSWIAVSMSLLWVQRVLHHIDMRHTGSFYSSSELQGFQPHYLYCVCTSFLPCWMSWFLVTSTKLLVWLMQHTISLVSPMESLKLVCLFSSCLSLRIRLSRNLQSNNYGLHWEWFCLYSDTSECLHIHTYSLFCLTLGL